MSLHKYIYLIINKKMWYLFKDTHNLHHFNYANWNLIIFFYARSRRASPYHGARRCVVLQISGLFSLDWFFSFSFLLFFYFFLAILHKIAITGIRNCRETRKVNPLYTYFSLYKLGSATRSRNRHLHMAPELDKYYFEKNAYHRLSSTYMHPVRSTRSFFSPLRLGCRSRRRESYKGGIARFKNNA